MYRHCIYCSADLGANEAVEEFPVGRSVAFDAARGRLWAVCAKCARWNLAPIEERWEAVEQAEKRFADSRLRVQSENVGLARMPDGTRLVRVGEALPGEVAAWRYGDELRRRRRGYLAQTVALAAVDVSLLLLRAWGEWHRVVSRVPDAAAPEGRTTLKMRRLNHAPFRADGGGGMVLDVPAWKGWLRAAPGVRVDGAPARSVLERALAAMNAGGADAFDLSRALAALDRAGSAEELAARFTGAREPGALVLRGFATGGWYAEWLPDSGAGRRALTTPELLALEMALHEEAERRALEGELALLEARWREAEEIAAIADRLAGDARGLPSPAPDQG